MSRIGRSTSNALISHFFHISYDTVEELPISIYRKLINQAINIGNWQAGGKFETLDKDDKIAELKEHYENFKKFQQEMEIANGVSE